MKDLTKEQLASIMGCKLEVADKWLACIISATERFPITTKLQMAGFLAQIGHESGRLAFVEENLNYSADGLLKVFPKYFNKDNVNKYARNKVLIASRVYGGRMGNGDEASQEGWKYHGRGLIQITGKDNYAAFAKAIGVDVVSSPELLAQPEMAALSAAWFWYSRGLNALADKGDIVGMTKRVNGGTIGLDDRTALYIKAKKVLGC